LEALVAALGNVSDSNVRTLADDGVTQEVTVGTAIKSRVTIPKEVRLTPRITFPEVTQPSATFVVRLDNKENGITAALYEADANDWRREAAVTVAAYIKATVGPDVTILGAG
jgi:hypothetical protein